MKPWQLAVFFTMLLISTGCMDDDALWEREKPGQTASSEGVFIINQGNFMYDNASLSYYDPESRDLINDVFFKTNGLPLGDVAQSMTIRDSLAYIVINNSGRVYVMNKYTFEYYGKITGLTAPRYMHFVSDTKAYISDLYGKSITIVNPDKLEITGSIDVRNQHTGFYQHATEQMVQYGKYVFVNCWSFDNTILVIDSETDEWVDTIEVMIQPQSMVMDATGSIWTLTDGGFPGSPYGHEAPGLIRIDPADREISNVYQPGAYDSPRHLAINGTGDTLYFINRHVYRFAVFSEDGPGIWLESPYQATHPGGYYSIGVDPQSSDVYLGDALDMVQPGIVYRFSPDGSPLDTLRTGIIPGDFCFVQ